MNKTPPPAEQLQADLKQEIADHVETANLAYREISALEDRVKELEAISAGRLNALNEKAEEARQNWVRAEQAEARLREAEKEIQILKEELREERAANGQFGARA